MRHLWHLSDGFSPSESCQSFTLHSFRHPMDAIVGSATVSETLGCGSGHLVWHRGGARAAIGKLAGGCWICEAQQRPHPPR